MNSEQGMSKEERLQEEMVFSWRLPILPSTFFGSRGGWRHRLVNGFAASKPAGSQDQSDLNVGQALAGDFDVIGIQFYTNVLSA